MGLMAGVDSEWSYSMAHALALDARTYVTSGIRADSHGIGRMAGVDPEWSHSMAHALALDALT
uniref:Uncharacterized protein n=1 Tax=Oryza sativa subsp. japonica TaxID=39947 RepID=Q69NG8_ORYSJ|nr:hypothetical protein [Oryza sativa Japonica Group]